MDARARLRGSRLKIPAASGDAKTPKEYKKWQERGEKKKKKKKEEEEENRTIYEIRSLPWLCKAISVANGGEKKGKKKKTGESGEKCDLYPHPRNPSVLSGRGKKKKKVRGAYSTLASKEIGERTEDGITLGIRETTLD